MKEAAAEWAYRRLGRANRTKPTTIDEDVREQFKVLNANVGTSRPPEEELFPVMACNWPSVIAFLACDTQWRVVAGAAGLLWIGLDYASCDVALRRMDVPDYVFSDLRIIEDAVLPVLNSRGDE